MSTCKHESFDALRAERDDLLLAIDRCEETKTALHMNLRAMREERDGLAAQVEVMRSALQFYMDFGITEPLYYTVRDAIALPNTAADILRQRDARTLRNAADRLESHDFVTNKPCSNYAESNELRLMAGELERKNG